MTKTKIAAIAFAMLLVFGVKAAVFAQQGGYKGPEAKAATAEPQQGGYKGPGLKVITVEEAKKLRDDTPVVLQGKIDSFIGNERYIFSDKTGSITIEIDKKVWGALSVDEKDLVEISGEVDKDFRKIEIDVKSIRKI